MLPRPYVWVIIPALIAARAGAIVVRQAGRGYGAACLAGIANLDSTTEIIVFLEADFSNYSEDLALLRMPEARQALTPQQRWGNSLAVTRHYRHHEK